VTWDGRRAIKFSLPIFSQSPSSSLAIFKFIYINLYEKWRGQAQVQSVKTKNHRFSMLLLVQARKRSRTHSELKSTVSTVSAQQLFNCCRGYKLHAAAAKSFGIIMLGRTLTRRAFSFLLRTHAHRAAEATAAPAVE
jgi:hypothetical protein